MTTSAQPAFQSPEPISWTELIAAGRATLIPLPPATQPTQAAIRRAISTAYYAAFHALTTSNADALIGPVHDQLTGRRSQFFFLPQHNLDTRILVEQVIPHTRSTARNVVQRPLANTPGPRTNFARFHIPFFITSGMGWVLPGICSQPASSFVWEVNGEATPFGPEGSRDV